MICMRVCCLVRNLAVCVLMDASYCSSFVGCFPFVGHDFLFIFFIREILLFKSLSITNCSFSHYILFWAENNDFKCFININEAL